MYSRNGKIVYRKNKENIYKINNVAGICAENLGYIKEDNIKSIRKYQKYKMYKLYKSKIIMKKLIKKIHKKVFFDMFVYFISNENG